MVIKFKKFDTNVLQQYCKEINYEEFFKVFYKYLERLYGNNTSEYCHLETCIHVAISFTVYKLKNNELIEKFM